MVVVRRRPYEDSDAGTAAVYEQGAPPEQLWAGLRRFWSKQAGPA